jgi:hypothetical protein
MPMNRSLEVLAEAGILQEDRIPAIEAWFSRPIRGLPEPMVTELRRWFDIMLHGSITPPRRRPRTQVTARLRLSRALPALQAWADQGNCSLREVSSSDVRAILPAAGNPRSTRGQGLRSIFTVLRAKRVVFINPTACMNIGFHQPQQPLPLDMRLLREALTSPDPARAAIVALVAFHGLRAGQIRGLQATDARGGRLYVGERVILLATLARARLAAWLEYRARAWPSTANPHLFLNTCSALGSCPVGHRWIALRTGVPDGIQAIREDRILNEAQASGGDIRLICDLPGLSVTAAERYTATVSHPELIAKSRTGA